MYVGKKPLAGELLIHISKRKRQVKDIDGIYEGNNQCKLKIDKMVLVIIYFSFSYFYTKFNRCLTTYLLRQYLLIYT